MIRSLSTFLVRRSWKSSRILSTHSTANGVASPPRPQMKWKRSTGVIEHPFWQLLHSPGFDHRDIRIRSKLFCWNAAPSSQLIKFIWNLITFNPSKEFNETRSHLLNQASGTHEMTQVLASSARDPLSLLEQKTVPKTSRNYRRQTTSEPSFSTISKER